MRTLLLLLFGGAVAAAILLIPRDERPAAPDAAASVAESTTTSRLRSYVVRALLPGADDPGDERFLIISPRPATLGKGVPPT